MRNAVKHDNSVPCLRLEFKLSKKEEVVARRDYDLSSLTVRLPIESWAASSSQSGTAACPHNSSGISLGLRDCLQSWCSSRFRRPAYNFAQEPPIATLPRRTLPSLGQRQPFSWVTPSVFGCSNRTEAEGAFPQHIHGYYATVSMNNQPHVCEKRGAESEIRTPQAFTTRRRRVLVPGSGAAAPDSDLPAAWAKTNAFLCGSLLRNSLVARSPVAAE